MTLIQDLIQYSKSPFFRSERDKFSFLTLIQLIFLQVFVSIITIIFAVVLFAATGTEMPAGKDSFNEMVKIENFILVALIAPLAEEILFRSWLGHRLGLRLFMPGILVLVLNVMIFGSTGAFNAPVFFISTLAFVIYGYHILKRGSDAGTQLYQSRFRYVFWITAIAFGLMHLGNFKADTLSLITAFMVLPQTAAGFIFGYTRMRFGFLPVFALHAGYNGLLLSLGALA